jgi:hypothetical protein
MQIQPAPGELPHAVIACAPNILIATLDGSALISQKPGEARGGAEFPGLRALSARAVERSPEVILGRRGSGRALQQQKLAPDAHQLGHCPALFGALGLFDRLLDRSEPVGDLPGTA